MIKLGVNIDHVATVRQARREIFPDPVVLAQQAIQGGATGITAHLREDRRHIQDHDLVRLKKIISVPLNMEMAMSTDVVKVAKSLKPGWVCLVPEKREELTTEGGLDLKTSLSRLKKIVPIFQAKKIRVSLFVDPTLENVLLAHALEVDAIELHTGRYARLWNQTFALKKELTKIVTAARAAHRCGILVNAGHGLNYVNVNKLTRAFPFHELNIGFAIMARALEVGMRTAVQEMKQRMKQ